MGSPESGSRFGSVTSEPRGTTEAYGPLAGGSPLCRPFARAWGRPQTMSHDHFIFPFLKMVPHCISSRNREMWVYPTVESMTAVLTWPFSLEAGLPSLSRGCCRPQKTSSHLAVNLYLLFKLKKKVFWPLRVACQILVPQPGIEPRARSSESTESQLMDQHRIPWQFISKQQDICLFRE